MRSIVTVYVGTLALIGALSVLLPANGTFSREVAGQLAFSGGLVVIGLTACRLLGAEGFQQSLASPATPRTVATGALVGAGIFALNVGLIAVLVSLFGAVPMPIGFAAPDDFLWLIVSVVILAPFLEEWLCRGVLWEALGRVGSPGGTLFLSAALFALLHGLGGAYLLGLPTRLVAGLGFGLLRARTGSLWPPVLAHLVNNLLAVLLVAAVSE